LVDLKQLLKVDSPHLADLIATAANAKTQEEYNKMNTQMELQGTVDGLKEQVSLCYKTIVKSQHLIEHNAA
jgi:hypothetical protein